MGSDTSTQSNSFKSTLPELDADNANIFQDSSLPSNNNPLHVFVNYRSPLPIKTLSELKDSFKKNTSSTKHNSRFKPMTSGQRQKHTGQEAYLSNIKAHSSKKLKQNINSCAYKNQEQKLQESTNKRDSIHKRNSVRNSINGFKQLKINVQEFLAVKEQPISLYYQLKQKIGEGSFGQVYRAYCRKTNEERAVKVLKTKFMVGSKKKQFLAEMTLLSKLKHPSIISIYDLFHYKHEYFVVMQYCKGGAIIDLINKCKKKNQKLIANIMKQLFSALSYMHSLNIVHRDIKLDNIVFLDQVQQINEDQIISIKIIDFGTAVQTKHKTILNYPVTGTLSYLAPQVMKGVLTQQSDIWSSAVLMIILLTGFSYFKGRHQGETTSNIINKKITFGQHPLKDMSEDAKNLLHHMLDRNYNKRISADDALKHPWLNLSKIRNSITSDNLQQLQKYYRGNNLISVIESFLSLKKINQQERQQLASLFNEIDSDGNGHIDAAELITVYKQNFSSSSEEEIRLMIEGMDKNKSGKIDFNQFIIAMYSRQKLFIRESLNDAFEYFDKDHTGFIQKNQLKEILKGSQLGEIDYFIKELDIDGDSKISREQFINYLIKNQ